MSRIAIGLALALAACSAEHQALVDGGVSPPRGDAWALESDALGSLLEDDAGPLPDGGITAASMDVVTFMGSGREDFGGSMAFADLDGDGLDEIVLVGWTDTGGELDILYGRRDRIVGTLALSGADANVRIPPEENGEIYVARGDYDGDGIDDLVISVSGEDASPASVGALHVLYGAPTRLHGSSMIADVAATLVPAEADPSLRFGEIVTSAGDADGDGCDDILVGYAVAGSQGGRTIIVRGARTRWTGTSTIVPSTTFTPSDAGLAGFVLHGAGDLDGDGHDDVLVGEMDDAALDVGVFYGPIAAGTVAIADADAHVLSKSATWIGLYGGFDANADGLADFVVPGSASANGSVHLFLGNRARMHGQLGVASSDVTLIGATGDSNVGVGVSAGDADGDGRDDLLIGSPNASMQLGRVDRVYGMPRSESLASSDEVWLGQRFPYPDGLPSGRMYDEMLGEAVAQDGDFDGDGLADALLGAPSDLTPQGGQRLYLVYGAPR